MTSIAVRCCACAVPQVERKAYVQQKRRPIFDWSRADLEIQTFICLASGGIDAGFDRILLK